MESCNKTEVVCFLESVALKIIHYKCCNLRTETDMKPPLALFDVAMSKLSNDIKNLISVRCANMTLFAWTVTYSLQCSIFTCIQYYMYMRVHVLCYMWSMYCVYEEVGQGESPPCFRFDSYLSNPEMIAFGPHTSVPSFTPISL